MPKPPSVKTFAPGDRLDRFRLERLLGRGAFGQVWLAIDDGGFGFQKQVALKILLDIDNPRRVDALIREARICGGLSHPNIIDVFGVGQTEGAVYIVMEYVEGETLAALWKDLDYMGVGFPRSIVCDLGVAVAEALHHAWTAIDAQGRSLAVVHRDLKPANIMVSNRGIAKVGDFGVAKALPEPSHTFSGKLKGTPSYLAPEVWQGTRVFRPSVDLFSLGVVLWELIVGRRFYGNARITEIFEIVSQRSPAEEAREAGEHFAQLAPILERLLQRPPPARYQSAFEVAEVLRRVRQTLPPAGDLLQFVRLVRAGRIEPLERHASIASMPAFPLGCEDWLPLLRVASEVGVKTDEVVAQFAGPELLGPATKTITSPELPPLLEPAPEPSPPVPAATPPPVPDPPPRRPPTPVVPPPSELPPSLDWDAARPSSTPAPWFLGGLALLLIGVVLWLVSLLRG